MTYSKSKNKWQTVGRRSLLLLAVLSLVITLLGLPLYAKTMNINSPAGRVVDDIKRGARDLGRGARDMIDPDGDGILPDGSLDNGIANDGNQFETGDMTGNVSDHVTGPIPDSGTDDGLLDEVLPDHPVTDNSRPSPDNSDNGDVTDHTTGDVTDSTAVTSDHGSTTDASTTTDANGDATTDSADGNNGFNWTGLIVAIVIAVAVIVLICLLIPKKKK